MMGPMGGGWLAGSAATPFWPGAMLLPLVVLVLAGFVLIAGRGIGSATPRARPRRPEDILRERYAAGDIDRPSYQEALVNLLKDRYVRGELSLDEYETRLGLLFQAPPHRPIAPR